MPTEKQVELQQVWIISQKMFELAKNSDWEKLPDLENERKKIMALFFSEAVSDQDSARVEKIIQDVLAINDNIAVLAEKEKMSIALQRQNIKKRQNVQSAYLQNK
ncbi:MAG: flagellar protein FliT [gamma proteobacterium symbiont of Taylorina sp.]|nr:flagellar protein FliT [gamma proteobacterium symbiont of Taylorina sp.]